MHRPLDPIADRSLGWRKVLVLCLSGDVRTRHRFSSLDFRLLWPVWSWKYSRGYRNDKVSAAWPADTFRCLADSDDRLSGQKPYRGIDRNRRTFLSDGCHGIAGRMCRIVAWEENRSVVRKRSAQRTLAGPFNKLLKVLWPKPMGIFKSIPTFFSHNLLYLFAIRKFTQKLTGQ